MAQKGAEPESNGKTFFCPLCLNLLEEPVATPCGHNYCRKCLKAFWDEEQEYNIYSCPSCMKTFASRPLPTANAELAAVMEQLKNTGTSADKADEGCYGGQKDLAEAGPGNVAEAGPGIVTEAGPGIVTEAGPGIVTEAGPEDVACDACTSRKRKALQSCMDCLASYCELHLQPHQNVALLKKHHLVNPSKRQKLKTCPRHEDQDLDLFCRTDQQSICHLCLVDEHSEHDVLSAAEERAEKQTELEASRKGIQQEVKEREELLDMLQQEIDAVRQSADKAVQESEEIFGQLISLLEMRREELKQEVTSRQTKEVKNIEELCEELQQDIAKLKKRDGMLRWLSDVADHKHFLDQFSSLPPLGNCTKTPCARHGPMPHFSAVTEALSKLRDKTQEVLGEEWTDLKWTAMDPDLLLSKPQPKTRKEFLKFFCNITLDQETSYRHLAIADGGKKAERIRGSCYEQRNPERFLYDDQVLSAEAMTGKCYWEVEWEMDDRPIYVAVAYGDITRNGLKSKFGSNEKSWALCCCRGKEMEFYHNGKVTTIPSYPKRRIGVYLDHSAGLLSFHGVSEDMTLIHRVLTTFTQPLHAGFYVGYKNSVTLL